MPFDVRVVVAVLFGLVCFGWAYNAWVERLERKGRERAIVSLLVVAGVAVTGLGIWLIIGSLAHVLIMAACFVASGVPMVAGSLKRYVLRREAEESEATDIALEEIEEMSRR